MKQVEFYHVFVPCQLREREGEYVYYLCRGIYARVLHTCKYTFTADSIKPFEVVRSTINPHAAAGV